MMPGLRAATSALRWGVWCIVTRRPQIHYCASRPSESDKIAIGSYRGPRSVSPINYETSCMRAKLATLRCHGSVTEDTLSGVRPPLEAV